MITVSPGETTSTVEITLAPKTTPFVDLPLRIIRGRFATEGGGAPAIGSNELKFLISDSPANLYSEVSFRGEARSPAVDSIRFQSLQGPRAFTSVLAMPTSPDGQFRLLLPEGLYRVSSQGPTKDNGHDPRYYVKGISFGKIDLMKELMPIGATTSDELVITLAKCRDSKDPLCA
jgi:hypothetical protein